MDQCDSAGEGELLSKFSRICHSRNPSEMVTSDRGPAFVARRQGDGAPWGRASRCVHLTLGQPHPLLPLDQTKPWGLHHGPWRKASSPIAGGIQSVSPSYGNDLGLWIAGFLGQEQAKISINTSTEPFMGLTRNFIGIWSCWHCVCLQR